MKLYINNWLPGVKHNGFPVKLANYESKAQEYSVSYKGQQLTLYPSDSQTECYWCKYGGHRSHIVYTYWATLSIISKQTWKTLFTTVSVRRLEASRVHLRMYTGEKIKILGQSTVTESYSNQEKKLYVYW